MHLASNGIRQLPYTEQCHILQESSSGLRKERPVGELPWLPALSFC